MREIKFRVWNPNVSIMYLNVGIDKISLYDFDGDNITEQEGLEVMQYTGLKDKNGTEIYEGDIIHFLDAYTYGEDGDWDECSCFGQIKYDDGMAQYYVTNRNSLDNDDFWEQIEDAEVIGNIHDNPELLPE